LASRVFYKASVERDLKRIDRKAARRLLVKLERELPARPNLGTPLTGEFQGLWKYRVGDYRVITTKIPDGLLVLRIGHRKEVYR